MYPTLRVSEYAAQWQHPDGAVTVVTESFAPLAPMSALRSISLETSLSARKSAPVLLSTNALNQHAGVGAVSIDPSGDVLRLRTVIASTSRPRRFQDNALLLLAAGMHAEFAAAGGIRVGARSHLGSASEAQEDGTPWDREEFKSAAAAIKARTRHLTYGRKGLVAAVCFGRTDLGQDPEILIECSRQHPLFGRGLLAVLTILREGSVASRQDDAARLNNLEHLGAREWDVLGAWSAPEHRQSLTFTSFLPNRAALPSLVNRVAIGSVSRSTWASQQL